MEWLETLSEGMFPRCKLLWCVEQEINGHRHRIATVHRTSGLSFCPRFIPGMLRVSCFLNDWFEQFAPIKLNLGVRRRTRCIAMMCAFGRLENIEESMELRHHIHRGTNQGDITGNGQIKQNEYTLRLSLFFRYRFFGENSSCSHTMLSTSRLSESTLR